MCVQSWLQSAKGSRPDSTVETWRRCNCWQTCAWKGSNTHTPSRRLDSWLLLLLLQLHERISRFDKQATCIGTHAVTRSLQGRCADKLCSHSGGRPVTRTMCCAGSTAHSPLLTCSAAAHASACLNTRATSSHAACTTSAACSGDITQERQACLWGDMTRQRQQGHSCWGCRRREQCWHQGTMPLMVARQD